MRDNAEMMSSTTPSEKYSCSGSPLKFMNRKTAMEGMSGRASASAGVSIDMTGERRFGDDPSVPHHIQQLVLADDVLTVLHQIEQQVEDLRPDRNGLGAPR